jgi:phage protein U
MMMALGLFVFELRTLPFQRHEYRAEWRHPTVSRVGMRPASQFTGPGEDVHTIAGVLYPELTGGRISLGALRAMAGLGKAWPLIEGTGIVHGLFVVTDLRVVREIFFADGSARKIDFDLTLRRIGHDPMDIVTELIGSAADQLTGMLS